MFNYPRYAWGMADSETRWLTAEEQRAWRAFLTATQTVFSAVEGQLQRESGIPHGYYEILVRLSEAPGRALRMSQLAEASASSKSRLSHAVARLEERGWIERLNCATDRRGQIAQLTDTGYAALEAAAPGHVEHVRRSVFDLLSPEQVGQLTAISESIIAAYDSPVGPGLGRSLGCDCDEEESGGAAGASGSAC
jgi:DNA-binding MarR family transcriptional regulator